MLMTKAVFSILLLLTVVLPARASDVVVAAASDLSFALKEIAGKFEKESGNKVRLTFGSSGTFETQISNGAPFDVFLSADIMYPQRLEEAGLAEPGTLSVYAAGRIVIWVPKDSPIDVEQLGMKSLLHPSVRKVSIANPQHAPYGRAAVAAIEHFKLYDVVKSKFVLGENISQAAQFVQTGTAQIGVIALSIALSDSMRASGKYSPIPTDAYPRMDQAGIILKQARKAGHLDAARDFMNTLRSPEGKAVLSRYGFSK
jgi:molybdate transport system substrate-binding protein